MKSEKWERLSAFRSELLKANSMLDWVRQKIEAEKTDFPAYLQECSEELSDAASAIHDVIYAITFEMEELDEASGGLPSNE